MTPEVKAARARKQAAGLMTQAEFDKRNSKGGPEFIAPMIAHLATEEAYYINGEIFHVTNGEISNFSFGEVRKTITKQDNNGMFTIDELTKKIPEMLKGVEPVTPVVEPAAAQKYVNQR